jgi:hypothetical protein
MNGDTQVWLRIFLPLRPLNRVEMGDASETIEHEESQWRTYRLRGSAS